MCKQACCRVEWVGTRDKTLRQIYSPHNIAVHGTQLHTGHRTRDTEHTTQHTKTQHICLHKTNLSGNNCGTVADLKSSQPSVSGIKKWCRWVVTTPVGQIYSCHSILEHGRQIYMCGSIEVGGGQPACLARFSVVTGCGVHAPILTAGHCNKLQRQGHFVQGGALSQQI